MHIHAHSSPISFFYKSVRVSEGESESEREELEGASRHSSVLCYAGRRERETLTRPWLGPHIRDSAIMVPSWGCCCCHCWDKRKGMGMPGVVGEKRAAS